LVGHLGELPFDIRKYRLASTRSEEGASPLHVFALRPWLNKSRSLAAHFADSAERRAVPVRSGVGPKGLSAIFNNIIISQLFTCNNRGIALNGKKPYYNPDQLFACSA
jgi:hypothetical protein